MKKRFIIVLTVLAVLAALVTTAAAEITVSTGVTDNGLKYSVIDLDDGWSRTFVRITGYDNGKKPSGILSIPALIDGYAVRSIRAGAFTDCSGLTDVYFFGGAPDDIYTAAFCVFPKNVTIHYNPYCVESWTGTDTEPKVPWNGHTLYSWLPGDVDGDGSPTALDAALLAKYIAGYDVQIIEATADVDYDGKITPRDSMILARSLSRWAEYSVLPYIKGMALLDSEEYGDGYCGIHKLYLDEADFPSSFDGEITIPIVSRDGSVIKGIDAFGFYDFTDLTSVTIPYTITQIGDEAFSGCYSLSHIFYDGTAEDWNKIEKGTNWHLNIGTDYVTCSDGSEVLLK